MKNKIIVEGYEVEVYHRDLGSTYAVIDEKLWKWTSKEGYGVNFRICFERSNSNEKIYLKGKELDQVLWVLNINHHISI